MPAMASKVHNSVAFQCPLCSAIFQSSVALHGHVVCSHHVGFHTCAWCATLIENESKIQEHARTCTELAKCEVNRLNYLFWLNLVRSKLSGYLI